MKLIKKCKKCKVEFVPYKYLFNLNKKNIIYYKCMTCLENNDICSLNNFLKYCIDLDNYFKYNGRFNKIYQDRFARSGDNRIKFHIGIRKNDNEKEYKIPNTKHIFDYVIKSNEVGYTHSTLCIICNIEIKRTNVSKVWQYNNLSLVRENDIC